MSSVISQEPLALSANVVRAIIAEMQQAHNDALMTSAQARDWLGVSDRMLWALSNSGEIPVVKIDRRNMYDPQDLRAFRDSCKTNKPSPE